MEKLEHTVNEIASALEQQVDDEINRLESMKSDDFEKLRETRLAEMKKAEEQKRNWLEMGHGTYTEIPDESQFFQIMKKSDRVIIHFYRDGAMRCKILDMHMKNLAPKHVETRFITMCAPKCPFLTERLNIIVIPTILCIMNNKVTDRIVGFTELGNTDEFSTRMLEWRLAQKKAIMFDGDLLNPPRAKAPKSHIHILKKRTIREKDSDSEDDDSEASFSE